MRQRIVDCEILDPASGKRFWGYVEWEDGVICEVGQAGPGEAGEVSAGVELISAHGNLLAPSFVDLYADFCEPGFEYRENIASGSAAAAVTPTFCCAQIQTRVLMEKIPSASF